MHVRGNARAKDLLVAMQYDRCRRETAG